MAPRPTAHRRNRGPGIRLRVMTLAWALAVARDDLARTALFETTVPEVGEGEVLLHVDRVGVTANNVTYALLGESFRYWDFFPTQLGWGLVPLWGFADVIASAADGVEAGGRVYGYLPPASHLLVRPGRADSRGFRDASAHRQALPSPYNVYAMTTGDPAYEAHREDLLVLYRQLSGGQAIPASSVTLATGQAAPDADDLVGGRLVQREQHRTASGP